MKLLLDLVVAILCPYNCFYGTYTESDIRHETEAHQIII